MKAFLQSSILFVTFATLLAARAATDLRLTSIVRDGECTTLTWVSHPGEFYTVYWTDHLIPPIFWRMAEVNVPSGGTNTSWSEGNCAEMMMMRLASSPPATATKVLSQEEAEQWLEARRAQSDASRKFLMDKLQAATQPKAKSAPTTTLEAEAPAEEEPPSGPSMLRVGGGAATVPMTFYRVARTAVAGFVDGWGPGLVAAPEELTNAFAISAGPRYAGAHSLAIRPDGQVLAWGANGFGQCDVPTNLADVVAVAAGGMHSVALTRSGSVVSWGQTSLGQVTNQPANLTNVVDVKAGLWHTLALRADGTVAAWGDLFNGTNSVPAGLSNITAIAAGPRHCLALRHDGTVVAWGFTYDFLGNFLPTNVPTTLSNVVAISAGMEHNEALLRDSTVVVWGHTNQIGVSQAPALLTNMIGVSAGWHYGTALGHDLTVVEWGEGTMEIGFESIVAVSAGTMHTLIIRTNTGPPVGIAITKQPKGTNAPVNGVVNLFVEATTSLPPISYQWQKNGTNIPGATNTSLAFSSLQDSDDGDYCVVLTNAARTRTSRAAHVETIHAPEIISQSPAQLNLLFQQGTRTNFSAEVYSKGTPLLKSRWERDGAVIPNNSLFGDVERTLVVGGSTDEGAYQVIVSNRVGTATSAVWQVKLNLAGDLHTWGGTSVEQTNGFQRHTTNLVAISAGGYHTLGLREDRTVLAWGYNNAGQTNVPTGLTNVVAIAGGGSHSLALLESNGTVIAWGNNNSGQTNVPTGLSNVTALAAGGPQSLALRKDGTLIAWGGTYVSAGVSNVSAMSAGPAHALALLSNRTVQAWSDPLYTDMTPPAGLSNVVALASGSYHALALKQDGTVVSWGANNYGETNVPAGLSNVLKIAAGGQFSLALKNDGSIVSWGRNDEGQTDLPPLLGDVFAISAGVSHSVAITYDPSLDYPVTVATDLLLIYHTNSADSIYLKNYYLTNRPMVADAMQLGVGGEVGEVSTNAVMLTNEVLNLVRDWYAANPTIRPRYILCFLDVPTRYYYEFQSPIRVGGVSALIRDTAGHRPPFVNYIAMGAPFRVPAETNQLTDCLRYIDKVIRFGSNCSPGKLAISASVANYGNDHYFLDNKHLQLYLSGIDIFYEQLLASGISSNLINYLPYGTTNEFRYATNLAGYMSRGHYGWEAGYVVNPQVYFRGKADWYIMATIESFNGVRDSGIHGNYAEWFWSGAFGRTNYEGTPVGAVSHTSEPTLAGPQDGAAYFRLWNRRKNFATCAWVSAHGVAVLLVVGDPFVKR